MTVATPACFWMFLVSIFLVSLCPAVSQISRHVRKRAEKDSIVKRNLLDASSDPPTDPVNSSRRSHRRDARGLLYESFEPLQCNVNLPSQSCTNTWSSIFTNTAYHATEIVIPCGQCVTLDLSNVTLAGGLDIQGKLVVPDGLRLSMSLPYLLVQGELQMSSSKIPDGDEDVTIVLTGTDDLQFLPGNSNLDRCGIGLPCPIGKKPFVVAGGRLQIEALPIDTPTWVPLYDVLGEDLSSTSGLVVDNSVAGKWGAGAQVLITSYTTEFDDHQLRRITRIYEAAEGYVVLELDSPIGRPTTVTDNPDFAVEVALLSRNILFQGANDDPNNRHGAHMMVYHTPAVPQKLEGVEFRNFGQQGRLGRYPIHFHLCDDVTGSIVSKNLVRESNQRCIVVHGSNGLLVQSNVAFDTQGHCFMTEDGNEQNNRFIRNLGALTRRVGTLIPRQNGGEKETDDRPSTFWMTNPSNSWEGNVAAGSEDNGYWLELRDGVRGPNADAYENLNPQSEPLGLFKGNVAHSSRDKGMRTYPSGFVPEERAFLLDSRFFRNRGDGLFLHNTRNVEIVGGVYADNRKQIDIDRADDIFCRNASIVGVSSEYRSLLQAQDVPGTCTRFASVVGIEFHSFRKYEDSGGAYVHNIATSGFVNSGCNDAAVFQFDDETRPGRFDYPSTVSTVDVEDGATRANLCVADNAGVFDIYLTDIDSSLQPPPQTFTGTSTIVSNKAWMTGLIEDGKCQPVPEMCYAYCRDTCLRTVTFNVDPTQDTGYLLQVCDSVNSQRCIEVSSSMEYELGGDAVETAMLNTDSGKRRVFAVSVPAGSYLARFLDTTRSVIWPTFVEEFYDHPTCSNALSEGSFSVVVPDIGSGHCSSLIQNGDAESGVDHSPWLHRQGGIEVATAQGINGSNAFVDIVRTDNVRDAIGQYLDTRCMDLMVGRKYEVKVWIKLVDEISGAIHTCDVNEEVCPEAGTYTHSDDGLINKEKVALVVHSSDTAPYQLVHGILEVSDEMAGNPNVFFYIQRNKRTLAMYVDNVSVDLLTESESSACKNLIYNGNFGVGDSRFWANDNSDRVLLVEPGSDGEGDFALMTVSGSPQQLIQNDLVVFGESYVVTAKFKLSVGPNLEQVYCQVGSRDTDSRCPEMFLRPTNTSGEGTSVQVAQATDVPETTEWGKMSGVFIADDDMASASSIKLTFRYVPRGVDLIIDDVGIYRIDDNCDIEALVPGVSSESPPTTSSPVSATSSPSSSTSGPTSASGTPSTTSGPSTASSRPSTASFPSNTTSSPSRSASPSSTTSAPSSSTGGPSITTSVPSRSTSGPSSTTSDPSSSTSVPSVPTSGPSSAISTPPSTTSGPSSSTSLSIATSPSSAASPRKSSSIGSIIFAMAVSWWALMSSLKG